MKKLIATCVILLTVSGTSLFAQNITTSPDSTQALLCKKWTIDYAEMGGMKIGRIPGTPEMKFEFYKDKTFMASSTDPKEENKGNWHYDPKKKMIKAIIVGGGNFSIISLKEAELVMLPDIKNATPNDPTGIKIFYKSIME
ncbi:MAG TPA: hypothetical protein VLC98_05275 [Phnomibacter sp.]|nr:hypothetical protein [Phnomibacter sp.]